MKRSLSLVLVIVPKLLFALDFSLTIENIIFYSIIALLTILSFILISVIGKWKNKAKSFDQKNQVLRMDNQDEKKSRLEIQKELSKLKEEFESGADEQETNNSIYKNILQKSRQQFWTFDLEGKMLSSNECFLYGIHYPESEIYGKTIVDLFGERVEQFHQITLDCISEQNNAFRKKVQISTNENTLWYDFEWFPVFTSDNNELQSVILLITDKTRQVEQEFIRNTVLDSTEHGILIVNYDNILYANEKVADLTGYDLDDLNRTSLRRIMTNWQDGKSAPEDVKVSWNPQRLPVYESEIIKKDSERLTYYFLEQEIYYDHKKSRLLIIFDSAENEKLYTAAKEKIEYQQTLLNQGQRASVMVKGNKVLAFNKNFADMFELTDSHIFKSSWDFIQTEIARFFIEDDAEKLFNISTESASIRDKKERVISHHCHTVENGTIYTFKDITDFVKEQKILQKDAEKAQSSSASKTEFLANMSHEIRTPINGIMSVATLMEQTELSEQQLRYLDLIRTSSTSLLDIINDILDMSKIEAGYLKLEKIDFSLSDVVKQVIQLLELKASDKDIRFVSNINPSVPNELVGDPTRLRQIFINLGNNAVKFTEDGEITFSCSVDKLTENSIRLHFIVSDTGIGIKQDNIDKIFQSFEQEEDSTTRKYGGTGLGLSITKHLIGKMDGDIWVESEFQVGTEFHFIINLGTNNKDSYLENVEKLKGSNHSILLAISNSTIKKNISKLLGFYNIEFTLAENFTIFEETLIDSARENKFFDVILIDYDLEEFSSEQFEEVYRLHKADKMEKIALLVPLKKEQKYSEITYCEKLIYPLSHNEILDFINEPKMQEFEILAEEEIEEVSERKEVKPLKLLLAEDNMINQGIVTELLESQGHLVRVAGDGYEVLQLLSSFTPDCILMDVNMPELDGLSATKLIREDDDPEKSTLPIIALTASTEQNVINDCYQAGMNDYISKPVNLNTLNEILSKIDAKGIEFDPKPIATESIEDLLLHPDEKILEVDFQHLHMTLGDDPKVIKKTLEMISKKLAPSLRDIREAIRKEETKEIHRTAHSLRGFISYFHFDEISSMVKDLEKAGKKDDILIVQQIWIDLEPDLRAFHKAIKVALEGME